ncbi:MAG: transketolase C-terminal domain-containing protein [Candidatus Micrarchaeia archaeon]
MAVSVMTGSRSVATAVKLAKPEVIAAYPVTPQTEIVEDIATFIKNKELNTKFIKVESEHSAMSALIGASAAGARTFTATASQGLMYMAEVVHWAAHARLPIVMAVATRALASPWSILNDHTDFLIQHNSGWIQIMCENNQEALDTTLQAFKIAERNDIMLPVMVGLDGFILTHTSMPVSVPDAEAVDSFLGKRSAPFALDPEKPLTFGNVVDEKYFMEMRYKMFESMQNAKKAINEIAEAYAKLSGRSYGIVDCYECEDAEHMIVVMGAASGDAKVAADLLRKEGIKAGVLRLRVIRPFPKEEIAGILGGKNSVTIVERDLSAGIGNILAQDIKSALYDAGAKVFVKSYIAGLGGRDILPDDFVNAVKSTMSGKRGDEWIRLNLG